MGDKANQWKSLPFSLLHDVREQSQRFVLIKVAIAEVRIGPAAQFELPMLPSRADVDASRLQPPEMVVAPSRIDGVDGLLTAFEPVLNERKQHPILVIVAVEKRADMTWMTEH
jgi:hypothetical protein